MAVRYELKQIAPGKVEFSEFNPRGESPDDIHKDETFEQLKNSVYEYGVLVPIVVREEKQEGRKPYVLLDGERRLRAALETGVRKVPAHITESDERTTDLMQAFHIHMLRKQWRSVAQARALKRIIKELRRQDSKITERDLLMELQDKTGYTDTQLKSLRRAIIYPESVLREVDEGKLNWSHLVQFEESFVEQLSAHYPELLKSLGKKKVREVLVEKARKKILRTRSLMENIRPVIMRAKTSQEKSYASRLFEEFITREDMTAEEVLKKFDRRFPIADTDVVELTGKLLAVVEILQVMLDQLDISKLASFAQIANKTDKSLSNLRRVLNTRLRTLKSVLAS